MDSNRLPSCLGRWLLGNGAILLATIFWGVNVAFTKALIPDFMTSEGISAVRLIGGSVLFWLASLFVKCEKIQPRDWKLLFLGGVAGLFGFIWLFVLSLKYGDPIDISIIMTLPPMIVLLIGVIFMHARPSWIEYVGLAVGFAGAAVVILAQGTGENGSDNLLGDLLAIASCVCYSFYLVILRRPTKTYRPINMLRWVFLFAAVPALFFLPGFDSMPIFHTSEAAPWLEIGFILLCPTFIAYFLVQPAIKSIGSMLTSLYQYLLPVFGTIASVAMGLAHLKWIQVIAMAIIIAGMILVNIGRKHRKVPPKL